MKNPLFLRMVVLVATVICARGVSSAQEAYACHTPEDSTLTFYYDEQRSTRPGITYDLNTGENTPGWIVGFKGYDISQVVFDPSFAAARPSSTYKWFYCMANLRSITGLDYLNTEEVTTMVNMFSICNSLTDLDLSSFNTTNVKTMFLMFSFCESLKSIDLSSFNTSNVTNMSHMFWSCKSLASIDLSSFNTSNVKNMEGIFDDCESLTSIDLSGFNTEKLLYTNAMFSGCKSLAFVDLTSFNTSNVEQTTSMFSGCESLKTLDLSSFNTSKIWRMRSMFSGCKNLETIYAGEGWSTESVTVSSDMFIGCTKLVGGQGTAYDENHVDAAYAHIDGGPDNPGYFTEKDDMQCGDVNGDGEVNIADINCIIAVILGAPNTYGDRADVNADGELNIADINAVIDMILNAY